jgi:hypothetical protein
MLECLQLNSQFVWQENQTERDGTVWTEERENGDVGTVLLCEENGGTK